MYLSCSMHPSGEYCTSTINQGGVSFVLPYNCPLMSGHGGLRFSPFEEATYPTAFVSIRLHPLCLPLTEGNL